MFNKNKLLIVFASIVAFIIVVLSTHNYGAGISPDSVGYIAIARNLIAGTGFVNYDSIPVVEWPPLYPALLAFIGRIFVQDPLAFVNILNAIIFSLIVYVGGRLAFKHMPSSPIFAIVGTLAILFSPILFKVSVMAWSEPLFILFVALSILVANSYIEKKDIVSLILLSLLVALSCLTRYIGISLVLWGSLIILFFNKNRVKSGIVHLSLFLFISILPLGLWLARNYIVSSTFFGARASAVFTLSQNITSVFDNLLGWYIFGGIADHRAILIFVSVAVGFFAGLSYKISWQSVKVSLQETSPMILFAIVYTAFLVILSTTTAYDQIDYRLLSPIYLPFTLVILTIIYAYVTPYKKRFSNVIVNSFLLICIAGWLIYPIYSTLVDAANFSHAGLRYSSKGWVDSQTIHYLLQNPKLESECTIYSNDPDAIYILTHLVVKITPAKTEYNSLEKANDISKLRGSWPKENNVCLVWFDLTKREYMFTSDELQTAANLSPIVRLQDGVVYAVTRK